MTPKFETKFDSYVCVGDSIEFTTKSGIEFKARIEFDGDYRIDDDDCHNTDQSVTGCNDEQFAKLLDARKQWFNDQWFYCGVVLSVSCIGYSDDHVISLWGIEANYPNSNSDYLTDVANELLEECFLDAIDTVFEEVSKRIDVQLKLVKELGVR